MAHEKTFIGQFLISRLKNPDSPLDPYDPTRESPLEDRHVLPNPDLVISRPAPLPRPPGVDLSSPAALPHPPSVTLDSPAPLPLPPRVVLSTPAVLPGPPAVSPVGPSALPPPPPVVQVGPAVLPPPPPTTQSAPDALPPPPVPPQSAPGALPPPPVPPQSAPGVLPPSPNTTQSAPTQLPAPPPVIQSSPKPLPPPPDVAHGASIILPPPPVVDCTPRPPPDPNAVAPVASPTSGYAVIGEQYSPLGGADPGSLAADPFMHERHVERLARLQPGKLVLHSMIQVGMFAQNVYGNVWNPALLLSPPPVMEAVKPALDLYGLSTDDIKGKQLGIGIAVDAALDGTMPAPNYRFELDRGQANVGKEPTVTQLKVKNRLARAFDNIKDGNVLGAATSLVGVPSVSDPLFKSKAVFENGVIPMRLKGDNSLGFRTFRRGEGDQTDDDSVYVPVCFTDLRPVGDTFRTVYFRPIITNLAESVASEWNKQQFFGRVDAVATYMSTGRQITMGLKLIAFGPEDIRTIYQKLHWLKSMVYPEYDSNLAYISGPVVRMRVGDVVNALGPEGARGLPGIIDSVDFDYSDALWELKKGYKLPRHVDVSITFTVLHDVPVGRGSEGKFGGLGFIDSEGTFISSVTDRKTGKDVAPVDRNNYDSFGRDGDVDYDTLANVDKEKA